ncbi:MAG: DUF4423 domain-containing protein [Bdellovibrionales bacterium]|nr:DUF4423 domain-containing protein [Bdellovibrionales bacterium]
MRSPSHSDSTFEVFAHETLTGLLCAFIDDKKAARTGGWSLGSWSRRLGLASASSLSNVLKGRAVPSDNLTTKIAETMDLAPVEREYLSVLVEIARERSPSSNRRVELRRRSAALRASARTERIGTTEAEFMTSAPWPFIIRELANLRDFREDPEWMANRLKFPVDREAIAESLSVLLRFGLLARTKDGELKLSAPIRETEPDRESESTRAYHEMSAKLAEEAIRTTPVEARDFSSLVLNVRHESMPEMKRAIERFRQEFCGEFDQTDGTGEDVYQLNLQFFPVTRSIP